MVWRALRRFGVPDVTCPMRRRTCSSSSIESSRGFDRRCRVSTWLYAVCVRVASDRRRRAPNRYQAFGEEPDEARVSGAVARSRGARERRALLRDALDVMALEQRSCVRAVRARRHDGRRNRGGRRRAARDGALAAASFTSRRFGAWSGERARREELELARMGESRDLAEALSRRTERRRRLRTCASRAESDADRPGNRARSLRAADAVASPLAPGFGTRRARRTGSGWRARRRSAREGCDHPRESRKGFRPRHRCQHRCRDRKSRARRENAAKRLPQRRTLRASRWHRAPIPDRRRSGAPSVAGRVRRNPTARSRSARRREGNAATGRCRSRRATGPCRAAVRRANARRASVASFESADERALAASRLKEEAALLRRARSELRAGALSAAFATLEASRQKFTAPELSQEREALAIELLYRSGERTAAAARAREFLARFPGSPHGAAIRAFAEGAR